VPTKSAWTLRGKIWRFLEGWALLYAKLSGDTNLKNATAQRRAVLGNESGDGMRSGEM
jgi:hypothetical protein